MQMRSCFLSLVLIVGMSPILLANSGGPEAGHTGSIIFSQPNCTSCHFGTVNSGPGSLALAGVPANYVLGQTYNLTVTLQQTGQRRWGFQLSSRARSNGASAGTLQVGGDGFTQLQFSSLGVQYIAHTASGTRAGTTNGPVSFNFSWRAPSTNVGEVVFSVAGNAANNDTTQVGDFIYTRESSSQPQTQTGPTLSSISPNSGPVTGGTPITLTGTNFQAGATVTLGGVAATGMSVISATQISATTPASAPGAATVVVTNPGGQAASLSPGFTYTALFSVNPSSSALFIPYVIDTAAFRSNLGMSNGNTTPATVLVQLIDPSGSLVASKSYTVPANGLNQINNVIADLMGASPPTNRQGYLILEPDQPISAFATPIDNVTQDSAVIQGTRGTAARLLLPTSTSTGLFKTTLTVINDSLSPNTLEIRLRDGSGAVLATQSITIAPYGFFHSDDIHSTLGVSGVFGPIELRSTNPSPANFVAVSRVYSTITTTTGTGQTSSFFSAVPY